MCRNELSFVLQNEHYISYAQHIDEENQMRKILKAMLVAYIAKKVKDKVKGRVVRKLHRV